MDITKCPAYYRDGAPTSGVDGLYDRGITVSTRGNNKEINTFLCALQCNMYTCTGSAIRHMCFSCSVFYLEIGGKLTEGVGGRVGGKECVKAGRG